MDKRGNPIHIRLPLKLENLIDDYAQEHGLRKYDAIIHLLARGIHFSRIVSNFHIGDYTDNFFKEQGE